MVSIIAVLFFIYGPSVLKNDYAWDDWELFINSPYLRDPSLILQGLVKPILPGTTYFRPLPLATFAIEFSGGSVNPVLSHAINLLIHLVNTFLVGYVFASMFSEQGGKFDSYRPTLAAAIYAVHPALVESVAWAAGRFDLLVTLFYLAAIAIYLRCGGFLRGLLLFAVYLMACFSKEMAVTLPVGLLLIEYYRNAASKSGRPQVAAIAKKAGPSIAVLSTAGLIYVFAKFYFMGKLTHVDAGVLSEFKNGSLDHLGFVGQTLIFYVKTMAWPFANLSPHHPFAVGKITLAQIGGGIFFVCAIVGGLGYGVLKRNASATFFSLSILCLLPVLNIIPLTIGGNIGHERFLTMPLTFFAMAVAALPLKKIAVSINAEKMMAPIACGILGIWLALAALNVKITAPLWQNDFTLWKWAFEKNPQFYVANIGYAGAAVRYQEFDLAAKILNHAKSVALRGDENILPAAIMEARLLGREGKFLQAVSALENARETVASQYRKSGKLDKTGAQLSVGPRLNSIYYTALTEAYVGAGDFEKARINGELATSYGPKYSLAWLQLSLASYGLDDWAMGEKEFSTAKAFIVDTGVDQINEIRHSFLLKFCSNQTAASNVCVQFAQK
jgi:tetratricopeptide (TPR) repeat protein